MVLDSLILQAKLFLQEDMGMEIKDVVVFDSQQEKLLLKDDTSMIGVGGELNLLVVISYENSVLNQLINLFMDGEEVSPDEKQEIKDSVSGEVINTIIGLALSTFPNRGKGVTITPPITVNDASNVTKHKNSKIVSVNILTNYGAISLSVIGSEDVL